MKQEFIKCTKCQSNLCISSTVDDIFFTYKCAACGFETDSSKELPDFNKELFEEDLPYLYRDISFIDQDGFVWYPTYVETDNGVVFASGTSSENWQWTGMLKKDLSEEEISSGVFKKAERKTDRSTIKHFKSFIQACSYINQLEINE